MKRQQHLRFRQPARELGHRIAGLVHAGQSEQAYALLAPVLAERTPFRLLDLVGSLSAWVPWIR